MNILLTGANSSIGKKLSAKLCERKDDSWRIILSSRSSNPALSRLQCANIKYFDGIDLLKQEAIETLTKECALFFTGPFCLVHSVGDFWDYVPFLEFDTERAKQAMHSHYTTLYGLLQHSVPIMINKGGGKILAFSCNSVRHNYPHMAPFTAAKAAVEALVKSISNEFGKHNIIANVVELASIQSEAVKQSKPYGDFEHFIPLEGIAETVLEILTVNSIMNGSVINCFTYSKTFFNMGYFQRIRKEYTKPNEIY